MASVKEHKDEQKQTQTDGPELLPAALFFTASAFLPQGVRSRDRKQFVSGLVEEHSPLPLEQTAWGYLARIKNRKAGRIFYYAAPRELVEAHIGEALSCPLLPSFAALAGLRFSRTTWLFFRDEHCLSAIRFPKDEGVPDKLVARFLHDAGDADKAEWQLRELLECQAVRPDVAAHAAESVDVLAGIIHAKMETAAKGKQLRFTLFQTEFSDRAESVWKVHDLKALDFIQAADLRDFSAMAEKQQGAETQKRIVIGMVAAALGLAALGVWESLHWRKASELQRLEVQIDERAPRVERLQEIESMQQAVDALFKSKFEPLDWLMAVNELRPPEVSFLTFGFEERTQMVISGQADEVTPINAFAEAVRKDPRFPVVTLSQVQTTREGAVFNLRIETGDLGDAPPREKAGVEALAETAPAPAAQTNPNRRARAERAQAKTTPAQ